MEFRASLLLTFLGLSFVELGFGQRGDMDINEWFRDKVELIKNLEDKLKQVEKRQNDVEAFEAKLNATVDEVARQKAEVDRLKKENEGTMIHVDEILPHIFPLILSLNHLFCYLHRPENETGCHRGGD